MNVNCAFVDGPGERHLSFFGIEIDCINRLVIDNANSYCQKNNNTDSLFKYAKTKK